MCSVGCNCQVARSWVWSSPVFLPELLAGDMGCAWGVTEASLLNWNRTGQLGDVWGLWNRWASLHLGPRSPKAGGFHFPSVPVFLRCCSLVASLTGWVSMHFSLEFCLHNLSKQKLRSNHRSWALSVAALDSSLEEGGSFLCCWVGTDWAEGWLGIFTSLVIQLICQQVDQGTN